MVNLDEKNLYLEFFFILFSRYEINNIVDESVAWYINSGKPDKTGYA